MRGMYDVENRVGRVRETEETFLRQAKKVVGAKTSKVN